MRLDVSLETIVGLFGISRQSYYQHRRRKGVRDLQEELVVQLVSRIRAIQPRLGGKKLFKIIRSELSGHGIKLGRDLFFDLLGRNGLLIRKRRRQIRTTFSAHGFRIYPNLVRDLEVYFTNQVWVTDITYLRTVSGFVYLHFITDAYSKKIMGYYVADNLETKGSLKALRMAITESSCSVAGVIHHSDRGIQYCSKSYTDLLKNHGILISMAAKGNPLENAIAERVNGIMKDEYLRSSIIMDLRDARQKVTVAVSTYNTLRPHLSCGYLTPEQANKVKPGQLTRMWK